VGGGGGGLFFFFGGGGPPKAGGGGGGFQPRRLLEPLGAMNALEAVARQAVWSMQLRLAPRPFRRTGRGGWCGKVEPDITGRMGRLWLGPRWSRDKSRSPELNPLLQLGVQGPGLARSCGGELGAAGKGFAPGPSQVRAPLLEGLLRAGVGVGLRHYRNGSLLRGQRPVGSTDQIAGRGSTLLSVTRRPIPHPSRAALWGQAELPLSPSRGCGSIRRRAPAWLGYTEAPGA